MTLSNTSFNRPPRPLARALGRLILRYAPQLVLEVLYGG